MLRPVRPLRLCRLVILALGGIFLTAVPSVRSQVVAGTVAPLVPDRALNVIIKSQYRRLTFPQTIQRIAVGDTDILSAEVISSRELLLLGRETGRTTLIVWFADGSSSEYPFSIERDLSVLARALKRVNPTIEVESAPDRDALILTGSVPDVLASMAAEAVARNYLDAGNRPGAAQPLVASTPDANAPPAPTPGAAVQGPAPSPAVQLRGTTQTSGSVINLIQVQNLPAAPEQKILDAIRTIGGQAVTVRRVLYGSVPDDTRDTLVLEGHVRNQIALMRVITVAARLFAGETVTEQGIQVIADEAGGLADRSQTQSSSQTQLGGGTTSSIFGGSRGTRPTNEVRTNFGRATAVEAAGGRIVSFIEVTDLPQVRVDIRLWEVNRTKLRSLNPNAVLALSSFRQPSLSPAQSATVVQGDQAARVGSVGAAIQNVLSFLDGGLLNQLQYSGNGLAVDAAMSFLEREGIAQTLSSPSLTVLSGELAQVQVGGEIPVPSAFAPAFGTTQTAGGAGQQNAAAATPGVFSSVDFVPFGVQLQIRPLVGEDDTITLDVQPLVATPDSVLTDTIRQSTGTSVATTAFQTRALRTSSRLADGQALMLGGLTSQNTSTNTASTPGLRGVPLIGHLFQSFNRNDQDTELIVVVSPAIIRAPIRGVALWAFPGRDELLRGVIPAPGGASQH
jgi:pilus assembly protein CpaC